MLNKSKQNKLVLALKKFSKQYYSKKITDLDESGTRLMINSFLTDVLGYTPIEEIKTEYMIRGTYADYVIQLKGNRKFLVEVKALSINLSDKHLRQAINYGANEGIEWALLTNGKCFDFYKIIFDKPIDYRKVFSIDLSDLKNIKTNVEFLQHMHKEGVANRGLELLWNKCIALDPSNIAGFLYMPPVMNFLRKSLKTKYKHKFSDDEIKTALNRIVYEEIQLEDIKPKRVKKTKSKNKAKVVQQASNPQVIQGNQN